MNNNWTYKKLGEVATFSRGLTYAKSDVADETTKKVLRSNNIDLSSHSLNFDDVACLNEDFVIPDEKKLHKGDIFICMSNGSTQHLGKVAFVEDDIDYAFGGFMGAIHPMPQVIYPKYAFYSCLSTEYRRFLASILNGININNLKWSDLSKFSIPVPSIETQSRIVSELDLLQSIIDKQKAQLKEYDTLAQAVFYDMLGDHVENDKGWEVKKLGEMSITITKGTTPTTVGFSFVSEGINFVKVESFDNGKIDASKLTHITKDCNDALLRSQLEDLDLLICIAGATIGKMAIVDSSILPANTNQACAIIRLKNKGCLVYIQSFLAHKFKLDVEQMGKGVAQPNLSLGQLRELQIPLPPLSLQQSFAAKIESIEKQKAAISKSIAETEKLFEYTMDKYFG